ncbi:MAG: hypothetical protein JWO36_4464 [Myxococcales bacterium]|nr:hypothetical protein [Myxococcales bacterium]
MRSLFVAVITLAVAATPARAEDEAIAKGRPVDKGPLGVGIVLGEPTGICARLYLKDDQAIQVAVGSAIFDGGLQVDADYVFHPWILQDRDTFVLPVYVGPGVRFIEYNDKPSYFAAGIRGVIGMVFDFKNVPLDAFVEVAGVLQYRFADGKGAGAGLNAGAGVRYYF